MRSQASKPSPKKGTLNKSSLKSTTAKPAKRKSVSKKKVKNLIKKALVKCPKKNSSKDDVAKNDKDSSGDDNQYTPTEAKSGPSKSSGSRSGSPTKRAKKELKDKKDAVKNNPESLKKSANKKIKKSNKKSNITAKSNSDSNESDNDDVKYKINLKKASSKFSKAKTVKKGNAGVINQPNKKKTANVKRQAVEKPSTDVVEKNKHEKDASDKKENETMSILSITDSKEVKEDEKVSEQLEVKDELKINTDESNSKICDLPMSPPEPPKADTERAPKFFTSIRSPRTVDIDVKCFKNSKGNLSMSERFLSMKCESKNDDNNKDKVTPNTLVTQGPEIDVYTFTEKVDSPKSILSDFRSPTNKNIGRVRPIARVKGTIIDKKTDSEKKKYSPHRPIEEVVKQLKANKRTEDMNANQSQDNNATSSMEASVTCSEKDVEDNPKPIVSKSYKMVARKSSITGKPFSPIKFLDQEPVNKGNKTSVTSSSNKKNTVKVKKRQKKTSISDDELDTCKFSLNTKSFHYTSSEESVSESNDDTKESSESECSQGKKTKNKKYKRITEVSKKSTSKELKELSKDSLVDLKDDSLLSSGEKPSKRRLKLLSMWSGPKKHRMASLNAIAKVHCLYENESRTHMELGLMKTIGGQVLPSTSKASSPKKKESKPKEVVKHESTSESEYENKRDKKDDSSESSDDNPPQRSLRGVPGIRSAGKYWDPKSSTSSSEDSEMETKKKTVATEKKKTPTKSSSSKSDTEKPPAKMKKTAGVPVKKKRNRTEVVMDLKDMVVQKRMASLNATAILAASYEKRSSKSSKDDTTSDSCSDESFSHKSKNCASAGIKSEVKIEEITKECDETTVTDRKQKVEVIVNQDTDVTITGVYATHHHEGFCTTVSGMQYRISSTSHTQTTATANCEKEGCSRDEDTRYTPLTALSSMQPPAEHGHSQPHPVPEIGGLTRRAGCSSAFTAPPPPSQHHEPGKPAPPFQVYDTSLASMPYGYYQPAGPLIKETGADAERALARYHPPPHYHPPHPPMPPMQYGPPYYPTELCYSRYYTRPPEPYHMSPQPEPQMVGVGSEPYPLPPYYGPQPCYQHSPPRYVEFRGCSCTLKSCPKNVHIGPATGKAPTGAGPVDALNALAPPGGAFRAKVRAALEAGADTHGSGKDPPLEQEPPAASDAPHPYPLPAIGGASPKREMFDIRDNMRLVSNLSGPVEGGPPSPARGSAGACAPQPPPMAPRRARLGKAMARRSLAGDDTTLLLCAPQAPASLHSDADDDVMAISPPVCAPIDLSSSDERATPLVDVKKENEGPPSASLRKTDAQALREHNSTPIALSESADNTDTTKPAKRRYSRPKLEIDMKDTQLEDGCKTNGIGEHVKLQKRRKVSCEQPNIPRIETVTKDSKKRNLQNPKRVPKTPTSAKKATKRKSDSVNAINAKKLAYEAPEDADPRLKNVAALPEDLTKMLPTNKSAMLLDKLIRKNSIHRADPNKDISPAELLLDSTGTGPQACAKKTNINNNIVENNAPVSVSGVRANTIAAVTQLIEKKMAYKNACKIEKVDSKVTNSLKSVLKTSGDKLKLNEEPKALAKCKTKSENVIDDKKTIVSDNKSVNPLKNEICKNDSISDSDKKILADVVVKPSKAKAEELQRLPEKRLEGSDIKMNAVTEQSAADKQNDCKKKRNKLGIQKPNGNLKKKSIENVAKLLVSKKPSNKVDEINVIPEAGDFTVVTVAADKILAKINSDTPSQPTKTKSIKSIEKVAKLLVAKRPGLKVDDANLPQVIPEGETKVAELAPEAVGDAAEKAKRCKLSGEAKGKAKLLVPKRPVIKTDEAALLVEDACSTSGPMMGRRARRRAGGSRRPRRPAAPLFAPAPQPRASPRWSNGWQWDGEPYVSKVYLNNDSRLDRTARCWARMRHLGGDGVARGDCVLLRASTQRAQPFVARVASLWENPDDGEMMVSLVWYYRPEHTERGREPGDAPDEVYASRHRDANSVACIEDKCYVLTFNEYCRYRKRLKAAEEGIAVTPSIVPPLPPAELAAAGAAAPNDTKLPPSVSPELVLFCRKIYDFRSKKIQAPNK